jgi:four helix bundle protein
MMPYERFTAWRATHELAIAVYQATKAFPPDERYGLTSQMRRAAFSAAANIAEGAAKRGSGELRRFLDIALGSLSELSYAILLARDLGLLVQNEGERLEAVRTKAGKLTWGLYATVSRKAEQGNRPPVRRSASPA